MASELTPSRWAPVSANLDFDTDYLGRWSVAHGLSFNSVVLRDESVLLVDPLFEDGIEWDDWVDQLEAEGLTPETIDAFVVTDALVSANDLWKTLFERNRTCRLYAPPRALAALAPFVDLGRTSTLESGKVVALLGGEFDVFVDEIEGIGELAAIYSARDALLISGRYLGSWGDLDNHLLDTAVGDGEREFFLFQAHRYAVQWFGACPAPYERFLRWLEGKSFQSIVPRHGIGWQKSIAELVRKTNVLVQRDEVPSAESVALIYPSAELIEAVHRSRVSVKIFYPEDRIDEIVPDLYLSRTCVVCRNERTNDLLDTVERHRLRGRTLVWIDKTQDAASVDYVRDKLARLDWTIESIAVRDDWIERTLSLIED